MRVAALFIALTVLVSVPASAQSLADIARREAERRQVLKESGKSFSNSDLKPMPEPPPSLADAASPADAATPDGQAPAATTSDAAKESPAVAKDDSASKTESTPKADAGKDEPKGEEYWGKRLADLREQLDHDEIFRDSLQNRIDSLTRDFVNRDDPAQRSVIFADRQKALAEIERVKKAIEQDKKALADLDDEARRAGVPSGWLR